MSGIGKTVSLLNGEIGCTVVPFSSASGLQPNTAACLEITFYDNAKIDFFHLEFSFNKNIFSSSLD